MSFKRFHQRKPPPLRDHSLPRPEEDICILLFGFLPLSLGFIFDLVGLFALCSEEFFFLFFLVLGSAEWHHWNNWKNFRFLLGTIVSVNSESCLRTGKSVLRFFFSVVDVSLAGIDGAKEVAADAKAAAYEVGILGSSTSKPYTKEKRRGTLTLIKT